MLTAEWIVFAVIVIVVIVGTLEGMKAKKPGLTYPYTLRSSVLTPTELQFYKALRASTTLVVCSKVRIADVLSSPQVDRAAFNRVAMKHVDFLLCDPDTMKPLLAVELDDASHQRAKTQARDEFVDKAYGAAKLPVLHVKPQHRYSTDLLQEAIWAKLE